MGLCKEGPYKLTLVNITILRVEGFPHKPDRSLHGFVRLHEDDICLVAFREVARSEVAPKIRCFGAANFWRDGPQISGPFFINLGHYQTCGKV